MEEIDGGEDVVDGVGKREVFGVGLRVDDAERFEVSEKFDVMGITKMMKMMKVKKMMMMMKKMKMIMKLGFRDQFFFNSDLINLRT